MPLDPGVLGVARAFAGGDDKVVVSSGGVTNLGAGAFTIGFIWRPVNTSTAHGLFKTSSDAIGINPFSDGNIYLNISGSFTSAPYSSGWQCSFITKPAGLSRPRYHVYSYASATWTHTNMGADLNTGTNPSSSYTLGGLGDDSNTLNGDLAVMATWLSELSDSALEASGMQFSLDAWVDMTPTALWPFNQTSVATSVPDVMGSANQSSIVDTTVSANTVPVGVIQVGSTTNTGNAASVTSRAPAVPTGAQSGDVAVVFLDIWGSSSAVVTPPTGFTRLYDVSAGTGVRAMCYWKRLTAADTGTYSFTWTGGAGWSTAHCTMLRAVIPTGDPIGTNYQTATATSATFPSVSVTPDYVPGLLWHGYNDTGGAHAPPTGYTETADVDCAADANSFPYTGAGTTFTASGATVAASSAIVAAVVAVSSNVVLAPAMTTAGVLLTDTAHPLSLGSSGGVLIL